MNKDMYRPSDNYERNFLLVKKFGGKAIIFIVPLLLLMRIIGIGYISISKHELMELTLLRLLTSKINPDLSLKPFENFIMIFSSILSAFFIVIFLSIFLASKDPSRDSSPAFGLSMAYKWSMMQLILFGICFAASMIFLLFLLVKPPEYFKSLGELLNLSVNEISSYKLTIVLLTILIIVLLAILMWFSQTQLEFVKSIRLTLVNSVARNTGAHMYGVFSITFAFALLLFAASMTFMYYCYKDAFNGFGISMETTYVYVSLALAFIRGLIPFFIAICALVFSGMVDQANTFGTMYYSDVDTMGEVEDPNMKRRKNK